MGMHERIGKDIYYEEAMRIPMILTWPDKLKPRTDNKTMMAFADLYPTLLSMMGFKNEIPSEVQTFDLAKELLAGKEQKELAQPYYYVQYDNPSTGYRGLRTLTYKFAIHATNGKPDKIILFDRVKDPYEMENIAELKPKLVKQLTHQLKAFLNQTNDPFAAYLE